MSEAIEKPIPAPPAGVTDPDELANGQDRWENCPLKDCKKDPNLLYEDFYLRGIRSDRLLCSACAVRVEMGYMAREEVRKHDDKFFQGTQLDNAITLGVMFAGGLVANTIMFAFGFWILAIFVGGAIGAGLATFTRRLTKGRVTRQMPYVAVAGIILGAILAPSLYIFVSFGVFFFNLMSIFNIAILVTSGTMAFSAWGVFLRRI